MFCSINYFHVLHSKDFTLLSAKTGWPNFRTHASAIVQAISVAAVSHHSVRLMDAITRIYTKFDNILDKIDELENYVCSECLGL